MGKEAGESFVSQALRMEKEVEPPLKTFKAMNTNRDYAMDLEDILRNKLLR